MFNTASRRLTVWYVACIMALSLAFSLWVYQEATKELRLAFNDKVFLRLSDPVGSNAVERQLELSRKRIMLNLVYLNAFVFIASSIGSYFLARRTLHPIEEAVEAQNRFTADASHELRTPLAAMKTELDVALRDPMLSKDDMRELLESNVEEIDRMTTLTQGLLTLARPHNKQLPAPVRIDTIVLATATQLRPLADAKHMKITTRLTEVTAKADAAAVNQIVSILLDNAIKYSAEGAIVTINVTTEGNQAVLSVADEGPGISADALPYIFERFYRADSSRSTQNVSGHGLGLSIAHKLVTTMNGHITAQNVHGSGAVFTVRLPR